MSYKILTIPQFDKDIKQLAKRYPSIKQDIAKLGKILEECPFIGDEISKNCFKIRIAIASKGKGKSGGARVITHVFVEKENVTLLTIYDKSQKENVTDKEIKTLLKLIE
ncbi:MAG: type II toxin-antitoxin system RelE/ParE family toxin [Bacteroidales bacterium]